MLVKNYVDPLNLKSFDFQRVESISNFAASIDIFKVFYLTVKHIVIKNRTFSA